MISRLNALPMLPWVIIVLVFAWLVVNPVEEAADHVAEPVARSVGILQGRCNDGWKDVTVRDEHVQALACERGGWTVWLKPDGSFDHAWDGKTPTFVTDPAAVPGW